MATDSGFIEFIVDQLENTGSITYRKMFGEFALYCEGKVVALVCDNQLFIKPTEAGRAHISEIVEAPPYPGAKLYFLIEDQIDDREWLSELVRITAEELPDPKPKKPRRKKKSTKSD